MIMGFFHSKSWAIALVCLLLGFIIAVQYRTVDNNKEKADIENMSLQAAQEMLLNEKHNNELQQKRNEELVKELENIKNTEDIQKQWKKDIERANMLSGLLPVTGEGVMVTLQSFDVNDDEWTLLNAVNELRAAGAQAISVNDKRVGAMSEIRAAADHIMFNGQMLIPPYEVKAIGDKDSIYSALTMQGGLKDYLELMTKVRIKKANKLVLPAIPDNGTAVRTDLLTVADSEEGE